MIKYSELLRRNAPIMLFLEWLLYASVHKKELQGIQVQVYCRTQFRFNTMSGKCNYQWEATGRFISKHSSAGMQMCEENARRFAQNAQKIGNGFPK